MDEELKTLEETLQNYIYNKDQIHDSMKKQGITREHIMKQINQLEQSKFSFDTYPELYPHLQDPMFNLKLYLKKEFQDTQYPQITDKPIQEIAQTMCDTTEFKLAPHQVFIRNFISNFTPYNGLLLYHGLGSGKTCSSIGVSEQYRSYIKQLGTNKKILVIASPNIQDNFKRQLFNPDKLHYHDGYWSLNACTGNQLIKEINPTHIKNLNKERLSQRIQQLIHQYYHFMGYTEFANYVDTITKQSNQDKDRFTAIRKHFSDRLIIIDEVHNIRDINEDKTIKRILSYLTEIATYTRNMKLLLLSATPMFNTSKEILWLLNLLRINDGYPRIKEKEIFNENGSLKTDNEGKEIGKELLLNYSRGYISFIQGENPFSFSYRIYPSLFERSNTISALEEYPKKQINNNTILEGIQYIDVYLTPIGEEQKKVYTQLIQNIKSLNYQELEKPLQSLNFVFPSEHSTMKGGQQTKSILDDHYGHHKRQLKEAVTLEELLNPKKKIQQGGGIEEQVGQQGLERIMNFNSNLKQFSYKTDEFGRIFSKQHLYKYSGKMNQVLQKIINSKGICLVFSQYLYAGCIPFALALEEHGFKRHPQGGGKPLFEEDIPSLTLPSINGGTYTPKYVVITGNSNLSPNNKKEINLVTADENKYGENVKVIIISKAGSEGIDLKNIRQTHILDPWYNMNRIEQIIGRGVRFCSHKSLPFEERNCEIYLYGTRPFDEYEPVDLYLYRIAEKKSIHIGEVSRVLKQGSVDCILNKNINQINLNKTIMIHISSQKEPIEYQVGNKPFSALCDYMETCSYQCIPELPLEIKQMKPRMDTYQHQHLNMNIEQLIMRIKKLFKYQYIYEKQTLIGTIQSQYQYPRIKIIHAIDMFLKQKELLIDQYGRTGFLIETKQFYIFQPKILQTQSIPMIERKYPLLYKPKHIQIYTGYIPMMQPVQTEKKQVVQKLTGQKILLSLLSVYNKIYNNIQSIEHEKINLVIQSFNRLVRFGFDYTILKTIYIQRLYDMFLHNHKETLIEFLLSRKYFTNPPSTKYEYANEFISIIVQYIKSYISIQDDEHSILYIPFVKKDTQKNKLNLYVKKIQKSKLMDTEESDQIKYKSLMKNTYTINTNSLPQYIGLIYYVNERLKFKIKNFNIKRANDGADCSVKKEKEILQILKYLYQEYKENSSLNRNQYCFEMELIMRYYQYTNYHEYTWFLPIEKAVYNQISKVKLDKYTDE